MVRFHQAPPAERWLPALVAFALPGVAVLVLLLAFGALTPGAAAIGILLLLIGVGLTVRRVFGDLWQAMNDALAPGREVGVPASAPARSSVAADLIDGLARLQRELAAGRTRLAAEAASASAILDALPDPLLFLDAERRIVRVNAAARGLFGDNALGRDLAQALRHPTVLDAVQAVQSAATGFREVEFVLVGTVPRDFSARAVALPKAMADRSTLLLLLHDLTAAKRAEQMRADFVANASHELRTPLSTLIGFIETLRGPARDDEEARQRFLAIMSEQGSRMARLIADLLSLSQIELDEHMPPEGRVDLAQVVQSVADMLQFQAEAKHMHIALDAAPHLPAVIGDRDQLVQVMQNLIDNALKYGRPGTAVTVTLKVEPQAAPGSGSGRASVVAMVRDEGEGIAREHLPRLTERFYRVDTARSRRLGGTGLGLAIVKHIVNRHRGSFAIDSREGEGSCFTLRLPAAAGESEG